MGQKSQYFENWLDCCRYLKSLIDKNTPIVGKGIAIEQTEKGRRISATGVNGGGGSVESKPTTYPCRILSGNIQAGFDVYIYANGLKNPYTATGKLEMLNLAWSSSPLTGGDIVIGHDAVITVTGGSE